MRLYTNILRVGTNVQTFLKPKIEVRPEAPESYKAEVGFFEFVPMLKELVPSLTHVQAVEIVAYLVEYAYFTLRLSKIAAMVWIPEQIRLTAVWLKIGWYGGPIIVHGFMILVILLLGKVTESVTQSAWGHQWTMRFEQRIWDCEFVEWTVRDRPVFRRLAERGDVIIAKRRNHHYLGEKGDVWDHENQWIQQYKVGPLWNNITWLVSVMGWVGVMDHLTEDLYALQSWFVGNLPPI